MISDLKQEVSQISNFLGLMINAEVSSSLANQYVMSSQKQRINALKKRHGPRISENAIIFDEDELLHHNHIHKGEVGGWRHLLSSQQQGLLTERYKQWLLSVGYGV